MLVIVFQIVGDAPLLWARHPRLGFGRVGRGGSTGSRSRLRDHRAGRNGTLGWQIRARERARWRCAPVVNVGGCDSSTVPSEEGLPMGPQEHHSGDMTEGKACRSHKHGWRWSIRTQRQEMSASGVDALSEEMQSSIVTVTGDPSPPIQPPSKQTGRQVSTVTVGAHDGTTHQPGRRASSL